MAEHKLLLPESCGEDLSVVAVVVVEEEDVDSEAEDDDDLRALSAAPTNCCFN